MGNCNKSPAQVSNDPPSIGGHTKFREERSEFERTGKVDYNEDELVFDLRTMLDDPMGQKALAEAASQYLNKENLFCWVDIHEYHSIPTNDYRRGCAIRIWNKYVKASAPMLVGGIPQEEIEKVEKEVEEAKRSRKVLDRSLFDSIGAICFKELFCSTYLPFRRTPSYRAYKSTYARTYNRIRVDDFDYVGILGQGGFGRVVHAKKKTTNQHLAMKIQLKTALLRHFRSDIAALQSEKLVFASCQHPFIVSMEYSFQTEGLVFIVLDLVTGGDLHQARKACPSRRLPENRILFYAAEIVLAIDHLHEMGIIYRDLKPQNVLLRADGHVQLTDMGLAAPLDMAWEWVDDEEEFEDVASPSTTPPNSHHGSKEYSNLSLNNDKAGEKHNLVNDLSDDHEKQVQIITNHLESKKKLESHNEESDTYTGGDSSTYSSVENFKRRLSGKLAGNIDKLVGGHDQASAANEPRRLSTLSPNGDGSSSFDRTPPLPDASTVPGGSSIEVSLTDQINTTGTLRKRTESRQKAKVVRSQNDPLYTSADGLSGSNSTSFDSTQPHRKASFKKELSNRTTGRSMIRKNSNLNVGEKRKNLTRGESLLHENLRTNEEKPYIPERRKSIVGTRGYMAPEMVELRLKSYDRVEGYTEGVDWFALGVTMFELLTGRRPFDKKRGQPPPAPIHELDSLYNQLALIEGISDEDANRLKKDIEEYELLMAPLTYPRYISPHAQKLMDGLMERRLENRLGCLQDGTMGIKQHEFFDGIDWDGILNLEVPPPFIPPKPLAAPVKPKFSNFDDMMISFETKGGKKSRYDWTEVPKTDSGKARFQDWDWISPTTLKKELGIVQEMSLLNNLG